MTKHILGAIVLMSAMVAASCSSPDGPSDTSGNSNGSGTTINGQTLALTIDGTVFQPTSIVVTKIAASGGVPETMSIVSSDGGTGGGSAQSLTFGIPAAVGVYPASSTNFLSIVLRRGMFALDAIWEVTFGLGTGTVEITSRTSTTAEGRVNVTLAPVGSGAGSADKTVVGTFSLRF